MSTPKGKTSLEARLIASLQQAVEIHKGTRKPARSTRVNLTARTIAVAKAQPVTSADVLALRLKWKVSQAVLAQAMNVSVKTVQSWEQGDRVPTGAALRLVNVAIQKPHALRSLLIGNSPRPSDVTERRGGGDRRTSPGR